MLGTPQTEVRSFLKNSLRRSYWFYSQLEGTGKWGLDDLSASPATVQGSRHQGDSNPRGRHAWLAEWERGSRYKCGSCIRPLNFFFLTTLTFLLSLSQRSCKMYHILDLIVSSWKDLDLIFLAKRHTTLACTASRGASSDHFVKVVTPRSLRYKSTFPFCNY